MQWGNEMNHNPVQSAETELRAATNETLMVCDAAAEKISDLQAYLLLASERTDLPKDFEFIEYLLTMTHLAIRQVSARTIMDSEDRKAS